MIRRKLGNLSVQAHAPKLVDEMGRERRRPPVTYGIGPSGDEDEP
jgi:hypothetical protein